MDEQIKQLYQEYKDMPNMPDGVSWDNYDDWTADDDLRYREHSALVGQKRDELRDIVAQVGGQGYALKQAECITEFWCGFLVDDKPPAHKVGNRMDTIDAVKQQCYSEIMIGMLHKTHTADQVAKFRQSLTALIQRDRDWTLQHFTIGVDYHLDRILQEACDEAGIEVAFCATFPSKTMCYAAAEEVAVSEGYRGEPRTLMTCVD